MTASNLKQRGACSAQPEGSLNNRCFSCTYDCRSELQCTDTGLERWRELEGHELIR